MGWLRHWSCTVKTTKITKWSCMPKDDCIWLFLIASLWNSLPWKFYDLASLLLQLWIWLAALLPTDRLPILPPPHHLDAPSLTLNTSGIYQRPSFSTVAGTASGIATAHHIDRLSSLSRWLSTHGGQSTNLSSHHFDHGLFAWSVGVAGYDTLCYRHGGVVWTGSWSPDDCFVAIARCLSINRINTFVHPFLVF